MIRARARDWWDLIVASDPGLSRLTQALQVGAGIGASLAAEYGLAQLAHPLWTGGSGQSAQHHAITVLTMLLGGMVAMMSTLAVTDPTPRAQAITMAGLPIPLLAMLALAIELSSHRTVGLVVLALVMGFGTYARKFIGLLGPRAFFYGMLLFIGYFFGFMAGREIPIGGLYWVACILWLAVAVNLALRLVIYNPIAHGTLARSRRSFLARARGVILGAIELLEADEAKARRRRGRRLARRLARLNEAALVIDGQLADPRYGLDAPTAARIHEQLFELELSLQNIGRGASRLSRLQAPSAMRARAVACLAELRAAGTTETASALSAAPRESDREASDARSDATRAEIIVHALAAFTVDAGQALALWTHPERAPAPAEDSTAAIEAYESPVMLMSGNLAGSSRVSQAAAQGGLAARLHLDAPAQTAIRVALAVGAASAAASAISEKRFYWAVIAVFITFMGANTAGEQIAKAWGRVAGTFVGILLGSLIAQSVGPTSWSLAVILPAVMFGIYFRQVSYALMVTGITIMVAQLYVLLGEYSSDLLVMRLELTALGAAVAMAAALVIFPTSTRRATREAVRAYLGALGELIGSLAETLGTGSERALLSREVRALDDALQQLRTTAKPLTRDPFHRGEVEHNLTLVGNSAYFAHNLVASAGTSQRLTFEPALLDQLETAIHAEVSTIDTLRHRVRGERDGRPVEPIGDDLVAVSRSLIDRGVDASDPRQRLLRALARLDVTLLEVAESLGLPRSADSGPASASTPDRDRDGSMSPQR